MIEVVQGDITKIKVDAIVNAANMTLLGGGGVDGAIHRAAGPGLLEECRKLEGCIPGEAKITKGHKLPAKWVIHTVGPVWRGGKAHEADILACCYEKSLLLAQKQGLESVAFPSISTGAYGYPIEKACEVAVSEVKKFLQNNALPKKVIFVCFDEMSFSCYKDTLAKDEKN